MTKIYNEQLKEIRELCDIRDIDDLDLELPTNTVRALINYIDVIEAENEQLRKWIDNSFDYIPDAHKIDCPNCGLPIISYGNDKEDICYICKTKVINKNYSPAYGYCGKKKH